MKILNLIKNFDPGALSILNEIGLVDCFDYSKEDLTKKIFKYDILVVGLGFKIDSSIFDNASSLRIIATPTTGLDHIDLERARANDIEVVSLRGDDDFLKSITGTSELAFGLLLSLARNMRAACDDVIGGRWDRDKFCGHTISGKTLGIVGLGRLGSIMAKYGTVFGMSVLAFDPNKESSEIATLVDFDTLIKNSDFISIHVHLNEQTENMFNASVFEFIKTGSYLINTSRGKIVNEEDVIKALDENKIAGYATDVLGGELDFKNGIAVHSLIDYAKKHSNVIITPHIGGSTQESRAATDMRIVQKIKELL